MKTKQCMACFGTSVPLQGLATPHVPPSADEQEVREVLL